MAPKTPSMMLALHIVFYLVGLVNILLLELTIRMLVGIFMIVVGWDPTLLLSSYSALF